MRVLLPAATMIAEVMIEIYSAVRGLQVAAW